MSISYCYYLPPRIKTGVFRFVSVFPICASFLVLPMFSFSLISSGIIVFLLSTIANLKLLLFCFDQGPLFPLPPSLFRFICLTCFPVKVQQNPNSQNHLPKWVFPTKVALFGVVLHAYHYKPNMHPFFLLGLYPVQLYLEHEVPLTLVKVMVTITLGCELEPLFIEPYLATSLQDFWGRRWNLMVSSILRSEIYSPIQRISKGQMINSNWARYIGVFVTFLISGLAHEGIVFYYTREAPTWETTLFFVLHGVCTATEMAVKRTAFVQRWKLRPVVSRLLTMGFLFVTSGWLFFPQLMRSGVMETRANETLLLIDFCKRKFLLLVTITQAWKYVF